MFKKIKTNFKIPAGNRRPLPEEIRFVGINYLLVNRVKFPRSGMLSKGIKSVLSGK